MKCWHPLGCVFCHLLINILKFQQPKLIFRWFMVVANQSFFAKGYQIWLIQVRGYLLPRVIASIWQSPRGGYLRKRSARIWTQDLWSQNWPLYHWAITPRLRIWFVTTPIKWSAIVTNPKDGSFDTETILIYSNIN